MHEMALAEGIVGVVEGVLRDRQEENLRVERINLRVGKLNAVVPDALTFCFEVLTKGTELEGAFLNISEVPIRATCSKCGKAFTIDEPWFLCPECAARDIEVISGQEVTVESIEVADE